VSTSLRHHVRLPGDLRLELESFAAGHGLRLGSAIRLLLAEGLKRRSVSQNDQEPSLASTAALAALIATEQTALMVASILPEGEQKWRSMAEGDRLSALYSFALALGLRCYGSGPGRQELGEISAVFSSPIEFRVANHVLLDPKVDPNPGSCNWSKAKNRRPRKVR
jgi:hypothetical protein